METSLRIATCHRVTTDKSNAGGGLVMRPAASFIEGDGMSDVETLLEERGRTHGNYEDHASITQRTKDIWRAAPKWRSLNYSQRETLDMIAHKVGRILAGNPNHQDHWADIQGYARLVEKEVERNFGWVNND